MLLFAIFCKSVSALNQIAVEIREKPLVRTAEDSKNVSPSVEHEDRAFSIEKGNIQIHEEISPRNPYGFHMYIEDGFSIEEQPFVRKDNGNLFIDSLESPVDKTSLSSLFFKAILPKKETKFSHIELSVSSKDYFNKKQCKELAQVFSRLGYHTKTIPESMAACIFICSRMDLDNVKYQYFLNLNGSKAVYSIYKTEKQNDDIFITLEKTVIENEVFANYKIETEIFNFLKSKIDPDDEIAFLPYEKIDKKTKYVDFPSFVSEFIEKYNSGLSEYVILQVNVCNVQSGQDERPIIGIKISINDFMIMIQDKLQKAPTLKEIYEKNKLEEQSEAPVQVFVISSIKPTDAFLDSLNVKFVDQSIIDGLIISHNKKYKLKDSRIQSERQSESKIFKDVVSELEIKSDVLKRILPNISDHMSSLKNLTENEKQGLLDFIKNNEDCQKLDILKEIKSMLESLVKLDAKKYIESIEKPKLIKEFSGLIEIADSLLLEVDKLQENEKQRFIEFLNKTKQFFKEKSKVVDSDVLNKEMLWLKGHINLVNNRLNVLKEKLANEKPADDEKQNEKSNNGDESNDEKQNEKSNKGEESNDEKQNKTSNDEKQGETSNDDKNLL